MESIWKLEKLIDSFIIFTVSKNNIQIKCWMIGKGGERRGYFATVKIGQSKK